MQRRLLLQLLGAVPAGLALPPLALAEPRGVELAVIVAKDSPLVDISVSTLYRVFTSQPFDDPAGRRVIPLNHPPKTSDRVAFDALVLGMNAAAVAKYWLDRRIRGDAGAPRSVDSLGMLLKLVARLRGAVGYVRPQFMSDDVKALKVEGVLPGRPGYRLIFAE